METMDEDTGDGARRQSGQASGICALQGLRQTAKWPRELSAPARIHPCSLFRNDCHRFDLDQKLLAGQAFHLDRYARGRVCGVYEFVAHLADSRKLRHTSNSKFAQRRAQRLEKS